MLSVQTWQQHQQQITSEIHHLGLCTAASTPRIVKETLHSTETRSRSLRTAFPIFSFSSDLAFLSLLDHRSRLFACRSRSLHYLGCRTPIMVSLPSQLLSHYRLAKS